MKFGEKMPISERIELVKKARAHKIIIDEFEHRQAQIRVFLEAKDYEKAHEVSLMQAWIFGKLLAGESIDEQGMRF